MKRAADYYVLRNADDKVVAGPFDSYAKALRAKVAAEKGRPPSIGGKHRVSEMVPYGMSTVTHEKCCFYYRETYEVVTEESAANGDVEEQGYTVEQSDTFGTLSALLKDVEHRWNWIGYAHSRQRQVIQIDGESQQDPRSGDYERRTLFIYRVDGKSFTQEQTWAVQNALGVR